MGKDADDKPRRLPKKFRASTDPADAEGQRVLKANDEQQEELGARINAPFTPNTGLEREMHKAQITIEAITHAANYTPGVVEQLAAAYAVTGRYDTAASLSQTNADLYKKYWDAVWLDDEKWCDHNDTHKYIREHIFSVKEGHEMPLVACNVCGTWNVTDAPHRLKEQAKLADEIRTKRMDIEQTRAFLKKHSNARP